jgi:hypothetical protein
LTRARAADVAAGWNQCFAVNRPRYPKGLKPSQIENAAGFLGGIRFWSGVDRDLPAPTFKTSVFERRLQAARVNDFASMAPRTYLALVHSGPGVSLGSGSVKEEASFHLVLGRW